MKILVISSWFPYPPINGAKIHILNLIREIAEFAEIDLISLVRTLDRQQLEDGQHYLKKFCKSIKPVPNIPYTAGKTSFLRKLTSLAPDVIRLTRNEELGQQIRNACQSQIYDAVIVTECGFPGIATLATVANCTYPIIADSVELGVLRPKGSLVSWSLYRSEMTWLKLLLHTRSVLNHVDAFTVTSRNEYKTFRKIVPSHVKGIIIPNVLDQKDYEGQFGNRDRNALVFSGSFSYIVNYQAVLWFTKDIFNLIPNNKFIKLRVTGRTAGRDLKTIRDTCPQIEFTGLVPDVRPVIAQSGICIVPIMSGGSTRLKLLEAMILGTPVVSTSIGAEGIDVSHGENVLLADSPNEFAYQIDRLIHDDNLWQRISVQGRKLMKDKYSSDQIGKQFQELINKLSTETIN